MDKQQLEKKTLIYNVIEFLSTEVNSSLMSEERKESIEVAIQCLETAYELSTEDKENLTKTDLLSKIQVTNQIVSEELIQLAEQHKNYGNNAMKNGLYEEAVTQYSKAIDSNPRNAVYFCNRAAAFSRLDNNQEAIKDCKQALVLDPAYGKAYGRLGIAYSNLNMWADAVQAYENSLKYDPDNASYKTNLNLAKERLIESMAESAAPPQHRPIDISQFINNESFVSMAREMMANPEFQNIMSGIMAMSHGDTNFEALLQAGQNLANQMQHQDPNFVQNLRRQFDNQNQGGNGDGENPSRENGREDGTGGAQ